MAERGGALRATVRTWVSTLRQEPWEVLNRGRARPDFFIGSLLPAAWRMDSEERKEKRGAQEGRHCNGLGGDDCTWDRVGIVQVGEVIGLRYVLKIELSLFADKTEGNSRTTKGS